MTQVAPYIFPGYGVYPGQGYLQQETVPVVPAKRYYLTFPGGKPVRKVR